MNTCDRTVGTDLDNILATQITLIHTAGADPDRTFGVFDRKITARSRRHIVVIDTVHQHDDLISRMKHFKIHKDSSFLVFYKRNEHIVDILR